MSACRGEWSLRLCDLGGELACGGNPTPPAGTPRHHYAVDELDGLLAMQVTGRGIAAVDGADRPVDLMHLFDRAGNRCGRGEERASIVHRAAHPPCPVQYEPSGTALTQRHGKWPVQHNAGFPRKHDGTCESV